MRAHSEADLQAQAEFRAQAEFCARKEAEMAAWATEQRAREMTMGAAALALSR